MSDGYTRIGYERSGPVATLTLNRPRLLNAMDVTMVEETIDALRRIDADDAVRVGVVTGAGRGFCSGIEMTAGGNGLAVPGIDEADFEDLGGRISLAVFACRKPLVAAVNGPAVGLGASITLPMDFRLASARAKFGFVFVRRGVVPEGCSSWFLPRIVGMPVALDWLLTGRLVDGEEARRAGLVRAVCDPEELLPEADRLARDIATNTAPRAVAATRRMLWRCAVAGHPGEAAALESRFGRVFGTSPDAAEGAAAFFARRAPEFDAGIGELDALPWSG